MTRREEIETNAKDIAKEGDIHAAVWGTDVVLFLLDEVARLEKWGQEGWGGLGICQQVNAAQRQEIVRLQMQVAESARLRAVAEAAREEHPGNHLGWYDEGGNPCRICEALGTLDREKT